MNALQKTLAMIAFLVLISQTVRHAYLLWIEPRGSVLDKYDQPLKGEIAGAASLAELVQRYDQVRKEVDQAKQERLKAGQKELKDIDQNELEPYKSEHMLREAIEDWESKSKEIFEIRFYWFVGLVLCAVGLPLYRNLNRWFGFALVIAGFAEILYWTSPTFLGPSSHEFNRLLANKLILSVISLVLLIATIVWLKIFAEKDEAKAS
jgi:hypothetical protein